MVYTLPSRATDEGNVGLAQVLMSHANSKESLEEDLTTESVIEIKDSVVEKEVSAEELKKQDSEEFMSTRTSILKTDTSEEQSSEATTTTTATTTARRTRPTTRTSTLQFYESVDGETTEVSTIIVFPFKTFLFFRHASNVLQWEAPQECTHFKVSGISRCTATWTPPLEDGPSFKGILQILLGIHN